MSEMFNHLGAGCLLAVAALLIDRLVGDPPAIPHPVILMGRCINRLERMACRDGAPGGGEARSARRTRAVGATLVALMVLGSWAVTWLVVWAAGRLHPWLGWLVAAWLASTTVASRGLEEAARQVAVPLAAGDLATARARVGEIVGRDTEALDAEEVVRAAVETVAENTVDAIIAPLFYTALGGAPFAVAYRCVNTLDSMWGYKNERYLHFGWAAARLDDIAAWVPARLTGALLPFAAWLAGEDGRGAWAAIRRDARKHPSPNAGIPEAGVAGALGVRLGGWNTYQGKAHFRAYMGEARRPLAVGDVGRALRIMHAVTALFALACAAGALATLAVLAFPVSATAATAPGALLPGAPASSWRPGAPAGWEGGLS